MAKPKWQVRLQEKLDASPLYFVGDTHVVKHEKCLDPGEKRGRKVTLRALVNYSFDTCAKCGNQIH